MVSSVHRWNDTRVFVRQAASLVASGYEVTLAAIGGNRTTRFITNGVSVVPLARYPRYLRWLNWWAILRLVVQERAQIVHVHDPELIPLAIFLKLMGRKTICDVHENISEQVLHKEWLPRLVRRPLARLLSVVQRLLPRTVDAVILAEDSYVRDFPASDNVRVVRNFPILPSIFKTEYATDVLRLIYVGDVRRVRGINEYARVTAALARTGVPVELQVIGSFADPGEAAEFDALVRRLEIVDLVMLLGRRPPEDLPELIARCDVGLALLHPIGNYRESYPTKMFEYMAAGLPVVASRFALWERVLIDNRCGRVVDPLHIEEAVDAIRAYWSFPGLREEHGRNGRAAAIARYHWGLEAPHLLAAYEQVGR
jgi:glycosyltransferase involved in cell wall biosynthesis